DCRGLAKNQERTWRQGTVGLAASDQLLFYRVVRIHVVVENLDEFSDDVVALERQHEAAVNVNRSFRFFEGSGQRDADVGMLRLAGAIDDAAHDGDLHVLDAGVSRLPDRHLLAEVALDLLRHLLEEGARGSAATWASRNLRSKAADADRLQDLLCDGDLFGAVSVGRRRERDANGVADAFLHQDRERRAAADDAFRTHAGFGEAKMHWVLATSRQFAIDVDQVLHAADLSAEDDLIFAQAILDGQVG